jgi:hypothetical protein
MAASKGALVVFPKYVRKFADSFSNVDTNASFWIPSNSMLIYHYTIRRYIVSGYWQRL